MFKRFISIILVLSALLALIPAGVVSAADDDLTEISNQYIKVIVNNKNGGYVISTLEGDILKKSDNNAFLTHRGEYYDTSFTSFKVGDDEYVFGEKYGFLGLQSNYAVTEKDVNGAFIKSTWSIGDFVFEQVITLINSEASEQLGTAMISYNVKNLSAVAKSVQSRVLIDTQLGSNDYGYYEIPNQNLGQGYEYFEFERTWDSKADPTIKMPADYFVRDNPYSSTIVAYGVNSVFTEQKPYKMTFAHWANIAQTVFDYEPVTTLNFTNDANKKKTADSAAALYYDLGVIEPGKSKSFSTYYGVTANLKNKDNKIIINTTAPSKLEFRDDTRTSYIGTGNVDDIVRVNVNITNPLYAEKDYKELVVVVYAIGFTPLRITTGDSWIEYNNTTPMYSYITDFKSGENTVTYFDFKFTPQERAQLGTFIIKVFDIDEDVNELGAYAEEYCLGTTENHIIIPGRDSTLPTITLAGLAPDIVYNQETRYITVTGQGMSFFRSDLLEKIVFVGDNGRNYEVSPQNIIFDQADPEKISIMLTGHMYMGRYQLHFKWKDDKTGQGVLQGVPSDFTSDAMYVQMSADLKYKNDFYGIVTVQRAGNNKYKVVPYKDEDALRDAQIPFNDLLLTFKGPLLQEQSNKNLYRLSGQGQNITINYALWYHGSDLTIEQKDNGTVEVLMDGKIRTMGANTMVRDGTAVFRLKAGVEYLVPLYDERGIVQDDGSLAVGQDFIELKWDNAMDVLTTIGGFLIDLKYGVLGRMQYEDGTITNVISFGGGLDLGFITPGGAKVARENRNAAKNWKTKGSEVEYKDDDDMYSFGLDFDDATGEIKTQTYEEDIEPETKEAKRISAGVHVYDVLFGGKKPGYLGINMEAYFSLPQIVAFLPKKIGANIAINTVNGYKVGIDAEVKAFNVEIEFSLVIISAPNGAPIPDKLFLSVGGFEPGYNIDGLTVFWLTGAGGGIDNLYDTIYGKDGIPPLTILLNIQFDISKILTGSADLELSLRYIKITFDDLSIKKIKDAKFIDGGSIAIGWYPNFFFNFTGAVTFQQIMTGRLTISAAAGKNIDDFVEFVLRVSIGLPKWIPIVGGMELASAELGGGSEKVWGSIELLQLIKIGFIYYWGGKVEFTAGDIDGGENFAAMSSTDDPGVRRTKMMFNRMISPNEVGKDPKTGEVQYAAVGTNLSYAAGSTAVDDFEQRLAAFNNINNLRNTGMRRNLRGPQALNTEIYTNTERTSHLIKFGEACDYILTVSRVDGSDLTVQDLQACMTVKKGNAVYPLSYYIAPPHNASDDVKAAALKNANVNVSGKAANIVIPKTDATENFLIEFSDNNPYDVSALKVNPIAKLTTYNATVNGNVLNVTWNGEGISDTATVVISAHEGNKDNSIILNPRVIKANEYSAAITIPEKMSSGEYNIVIALSEENVSYDTYDAGKVTITNSKAPGAPDSATMENCGNDKLRINVATAQDNFDGYLVEVYEDGLLADTGLYFAKGEEIIVGGRYMMPVLDADGNPIPIGGNDKYGNPLIQTVPVGYTPGKSYVAKVRLCNIEKDADGNDLYHCSAYATTGSVVLKGETPPDITIGYDKATGEIKVTSDVPVVGEMYINAATQNGEWYEYKVMSSEISQSVNLPDGEHTIEFHATDADGDKSITTEIISIDTTPPVLLLALPQNGSFFDGDSVTVVATAEENATYTFKINGKVVAPEEDKIFTDRLMKCTLPLGEAKKLSRIQLDITGRDAAGNEVFKTLTLLNRKLSEIKSISIECPDKPVIKGKLTLAEGETAHLKVYGMTDNEKIDITDLPGITLKVMSGTAVSMDRATVTAGLVGQSLIYAKFALGGIDALYDGIVVEVSDEALVFTGLQELLAEAKQIKKDGLTDNTRNELENAINSAEQIIVTEGIHQSDIDNASTALSNAIAKVRAEISAGSTPYYYISFNPNGGSNVRSQRVDYGKTVAEPTNPVKAGYTFEGWYTDTTLKTRYNFTKEVTSAFTLYAKWTKNEETQWYDQFTDVDENDWFYEAVKFVYETGLMRGISDKEFAPELLATRAMFVTVIHRMESEPESQPCPFTDVPKGSYYEKAVAWAAANGIVNGVSEDSFAPNNNITREQMATMIYRYAKYKGLDISVVEKTDIASYDDYNSISQYAIEPAKYVVGTKIMIGRTETTFNPLEYTTRAEMATVLMRMLDKMN